MILNYIPTQGLTQNNLWYSIHSNNSLKSPAVPAHAQFVLSSVPRISTIASLHWGYGAAQLLVSASALQACSYLSRLVRQFLSPSRQALASVWQLGRSSSRPLQWAGVWAHGGWRIDWARKHWSSAPFFLKLCKNNKIVFHIVWKKSIKTLEKYSQISNK